MEEKNFNFHYRVYNDSNELEASDSSLLEKARKITGLAYAPYSKFSVGAVALLANGEIVTGTNQENASYPVGICAERVLLGNAAMNYPGMPIVTLAVSYQSEAGKSDKPISPCGMCRQSLLEYEGRTGAGIRLILSGQTGKVIILQTASHLLPFAFTSEELGS